MTRWYLMTLLLLCAGQASAEIYKCSDADGRVIYQGTPCATTTLGRIEAPPAVSEEDRQRARERLRQMQEANSQYDAAREQEWQQQEARRRIEEEAYARQQAELEAERRAPLYWYPWRQNYPARWQHYPRFGKQETVRQKQNGVYCVPTYVGGRSCQ